MSKTDWNNLLSHYKGSIYNMADVVKFAQSQGVDVPTALDLVAAEFPLVEKGEMLPVPKFFASFEPNLKFDAGVWEQMSIAASLPVFYGGALMPDAHSGYALPVGGVAVLENALSPAFIGYDIGCRVTYSPLGISEQNVEAAKAAIKHIARFGFDTNEGQNAQWHPVLENPLWDEIPFLRGLKDKARLQLGTSGSGNHFIDLMKAGNGYGILTHSGSRGVGHKVGTYYMNLAEKLCPANAPKGYGYLIFDSAEGREYWAAMQLMGEYAQACHHLIHARINLALRIEGIDTDVRENVLSGSQLKSVYTVVDGIQNTEHISVIENHHNFAWLEYGPNGEVLLIHRKGATPAARGQVGIIPGSSGSNSYVVLGMQAMEGFAYHSPAWNSSSHGAGRVSSRKAAKANHDAVAMEKHYQDFGTELFGVAPDETVAAYKNVEDVMYAQRHLVEKVLTLKPIFAAMGGLQKSDDGD